MALQEFLASYAVKVDEDGARRLQRILEQNRSAGAELASVFASARDALAALKKELSETSGLKNALEGLLSGGGRVPSGSAGGSSAGSAASAAVPAVSAVQAGVSTLSVRADFAAADESLEAFRKRAETEQPKLSVNTTGITSSVSSAVATVRNMLASLRIDLPVTVTPHLDASALNYEMGNLPTNWNLNLPSGNSSPSGNTSSGNPSSGRSSSPSSGNSNPSSSRDRNGNTISRLGIGGRVNQPTLAMIAEEGEPEYVIPTGNESRAVPLLQSLFSELSESAKASVFSSLKKGKEGDPTIGNAELQGTPAFSTADTKQQVLSSAKTPELPALSEATVPVEKLNGSSSQMELPLPSQDKVQLARLNGSSSQLELPTLSAVKVPGGTGSPLELPLLSEAKVPLENLSRAGSQSISSSLTRSLQGREGLQLSGEGYSIPTSGALQGDASAASIPLSGPAAAANPTLSSVSDLPSASALSDLRSVLSDLASAAREAFRPSGAAGGGVQNVQAPVNIHVTAAAASPEAVARGIYDTVQRSLLKTLKGVFV